MRTTFLQELYLQRPITLIVLICIIAVIPFIGLGDFATKGEPREAVVALSMMESGNYVLPQVYADEYSYKPPLAHWLMVAFSLPQGYVSEFTARLPSALAYIILIGLTLFFFGKRSKKFQEAFIACLILVTCIEIHRAGMTTRVDMLLTTLIVAGLFQLYRWEERLELKGLPVIIPLLLGLAILTKGFVGVILPLFVFGVYLLMLRRYSLFIIFKALLYIGISSLFLPCLWYLAAWQQGGQEFVNLVLAENFGRFFHFEVPENAYILGHDRPVWYNLVTLIAGFIPWTILFVFSLFGAKWKKPEKSLKEILKGWWNKILNMDKVKLFSLVALVCIIFFYSIPSSKRSVYLMPAYPFIALFLAQYIIYLTEYRTKVTRIFAAFLASVVLVAVAILCCTMIGIIDPVSIVKTYTNDSSAIINTESIANMFKYPNFVSIITVSAVVVALSVTFYQLSKKINIKILYATFGIVFAANMLVHGIVMKGIKNDTSSKPFAERIREDYPLTSENVFVMNYPKEYRNLYGLNYYLGNIFHNFEDNLPESGFFLISSDEIEKVGEKYGDKYVFNKLTSTEKEIEETGRNISLYQFKRK